jgi:nitrogen regulatory protein PII
MSDAMKLILAIVKPFKVTEIVDAIRNDAGFPGMTVFPVSGFGREKTALHERTRSEELQDFVEHSAVLVAAPAGQVASIIERVRAAAHTGRPGDGKILVLDLDEAVRIASGESGEAALR